MTTTTATAHEIRWLPWGPAVFERAKTEDKLILFDSGATWCHWCHVMDRVTYDDEQVIELVNESFIPVRIDRDRLPAVDAHYQRTAPLIRSSGNGWPLTVVITPEGHTLFKATFLPPRADRQYGARTGLIDVLTQLDMYWREHRDEITTAGQQVRQHTAGQLDTAYIQPGKLGPAQVAAVVAGIKDAYDARHGGFGGAPKFFAASSLSLLLNRAWAGDTRGRQMVEHTLEAMARGGVYDHVGGGFHRYSVDERWHVPHFEKMAYDNAALLALYSNAYALTGREDFARIARRTLAWIARDLTAPDGKGFYSSQDADVGLDDDGEYFTWTLGEARQAAGSRADDLVAWYGIDAVGDMHGHRGHNVLHTPKTLGQLAELTGKPQAELARSLADGTAALLAARAKRTAPGVDKTVFVDLNGMLIDAHLTAWERLGDDAARRAALTALDHLLASLRDERGVFAHYREGDELRRVGLLADQAWMLRALIHAYAVTTDPRYLASAASVARFIREHLTAKDGGLLSHPRPASTQPTAIAPRRAWEDAPSRSAASVAAQALIDLGYLTGRDDYAVTGTKAMESFAGGIDRRFGTFLGGYGIATEHALNGPRTVVVVGAAGHRATASLARAARRHYLPGGLVLVLDSAAAAHAEQLDRLGYKSLDRPVAYVCRGKTCLAPAGTPEELEDRLGRLRTNE